MKWAVITGDIVNSTFTPADVWMEKATIVLSRWGNDPSDWEFYRGDSFQWILPVEEAAKAFFMLKASIKQVEGLDVRASIGIGEISHRDQKVTRSQGEAFVRSGRTFEALKHQTIRIATGDEQKDETFNTMMALAEKIWANCPPMAAKTIRLAWDNPTLTQSELAALAQKSQSTVNESLKRGGYDVLNLFLEYYKKNILL